MVPRNEAKLNKLVTMFVVPIATLAVGSVHGQPIDRSATWPDTPTARVAALALLETLNADLLSNDSATLTLDRWCEAHKLAAPAKIVAERLHDRQKEPTEQIRQMLNVDAAEPIHYRHVRLHCGERVLSEADNWYVPAKLTPEMNHDLDTSDAPFGRVVQPLHFRRHTVSAKLLWSPLPEGWELASHVPPATGATLQIPNQTLQHEAVLSLQDGTPFSLVVETYTGEVLDFPVPRAVVKQRRGDASIR
jgi:chorismate-pyruvate lyase